MIGVEDCHSGDRFAVQPIFDQAEDVHAIYKAMLLTGQPTETAEFRAEMLATGSWIGTYSGADGKSTRICAWLEDEKARRRAN